MMAIILISTIIFQRMRKYFILIQVLMLLGFFLLRTLPLLREFNLNRSLASGVIELSSALVVIYGNVHLINVYLNQKKKTLLFVFFFILLLTLAMAVQLVGYYFINNIIWPSAGATIEEISYKFLIFTYVELLIYVILSTPVKFAFDYFKLLERQQQIENQGLQSELKYLKLQINPHFLFNTLNNLLALARNKSPQTPKVIEGLAFLMRYLLEESKQDQVSLEEEIEFLNAYLELEKIRLPQIDIAIDIEGDPRGKVVPPLLFLPLVENAIKHGAHISAKNNFVFIDFEIISSELLFKVQNSVQPQINNPKGGLGLKNLKKRLQLIYGKSALLNYDKNEDGTFFATLSIPT